ncbi:MAG: hypothetical protein Q9191_008404, partial [Dirinaria sp. TL-2023a]
MSNKSITDEEGSLVQISATLRTFAITEIREMIMDHLDISSLLELTAALPAALHSFQEYHRRFFASALAKACPTWRYLAIALLALPEQELSDEATEPCPPCECPQPRNNRFLPELPWHRVPAASPLELYLDRYLDNDNDTLPDSIVKPLEKLKRLASIVELVEHLSAAPIWNRVAWPQCGASSVTSISWERELSEIQQITVALWQFELYCTLYHPKSGPKPIESQRKFIYMIRRNLTEREVFIQVYLDLIRFLGMVYQENIILSFEDVYKRRANGFRNEQCVEEGGQERDSKGKMGIDQVDGQAFVPGRLTEYPESWLEDLQGRALCVEVHDDFLAFADYHASLGLSFTARILRLVSDPNHLSSVYTLPEQQHKSTSFLGH